VLGADGAGVGNAGLPAAPGTPHHPQHFSPPSPTPRSPLPTRLPRPASPPRSPPAAGAGSGAGPRSTPGSRAARGRCPRPAAGKRLRSAPAWRPRCPGNRPGPRPPRPPRPPGTSPQPVGHSAVTGRRDQRQGPPQGQGMLWPLLGSRPSAWGHPPPPRASRGCPPGVGLTNTRTLKTNIRYFTQLRTPMGTPGSGSRQRPSLWRGEQSPGHSQPQPVLDLPGAGGTRGPARSCPKSPEHHPPPTTSRCTPKEPQAPGPPQTPPPLTQRLRPAPAAPL